MDIKLTLQQRNKLINSLPNEVRYNLKDIERCLTEVDTLRNDGGITQEQKENFLLLVQHYVDQQNRG